jgi:hypothetical protein
MKLQAKCVNDTTNLVLRTIANRFTYYSLSWLSLTNTVTSLSIWLSICFSNLSILGLISVAIRIHASRWKSVTFTKVLAKTTMQLGGVVKMLEIEYIRRTRQLWTFERNILKVNE